MEGFMMMENLNYRISQWMLQFLKGQTDAISRKLHLRNGSWINSPVVFLASSSVYLHMSPRLPPPFEVDPSHYAFELHSCTHRQIWEVSYIGIFRHSMCYTMLFYFLLLQLIVEEWLFEIVSISFRRWSEALWVLTHYWCPLHPVHLSLNSLFLHHPNGNWKMRGVWVVCLGDRLGSWSLF